MRIVWLPTLSTAVNVTDRDPGVRFNVAGFAVQLAMPDAVSAHSNTGVPLDVVVSC